MIPFEGESRLEGKTALITGITGQDGSYLAELLIQKGYTVHGLARRNASEDGVNTDNISSIKAGITIHKGDVIDAHYLLQLVRQVKPDEIYHLAAQTHVSQSFDTPGYTMQVNTLGTLNLLQAIRAADPGHPVKLYNASTSELFGGTIGLEEKLCETSTLCPKSPYAISKLSAYWLVRNYRDAYGLWAVNGILFNHESPRRGSGFVTMRISRAVALHVLGLSKDPLSLAGVEMERDWGHARDYVVGIWAMLQQDIPRDLVLATGEKHSVKEFVKAAFGCVGINLRWYSSPDYGFQASDVSTSEVLVRVEPSLQRPIEVPCLIGDASLARKHMNWRPNTSFPELVQDMVNSEIRRIQQTIQRKVD